ncbi:MAG: methyltransferase domain-containing protein [Elusimicrobiota bacterium]
MSKKKANKRPHYGYYGFGYFHLIVGVDIILGAVVAIFLSEVIGIIAIVLGLWSLLGYWVGMYFSRQHEPYDLSDILNLKGDENVLDVGCGLGKATIGVAKLLNEGKAIGIDIWDRMDIMNASLERAYENAKIEGIKDKVEFRTGDALNIPFQDNSFDVVVAASLLDSFWSDSKRLKFLSEVLRVLRPGGKFLSMEPLRNLWMIVMIPLLAWKFLPKEKCIDLLERSGFVNLEYKYKDEMGYFLVEKRR